METTALPNDIIVEEIFYSKGNDKIRVQRHEGVFTIETSNWEFKDVDELTALLKIFGNKPQKVEVKPVIKATAPKKAPAPKKATAKPAKTTRKQPAKRIVWTDEQKKEIEERYKNGEGPSAIAKDYGCTANAIHQLRLRMGFERGGKGKFETPAEQEDREKKQKKALKEFRESQDLPWYLRDSKSNKKDLHYGNFQEKKSQGRADV